MREQLEQRLKELKAEFESGQKMIADLESREANMRVVLHRISGAIQVLQEELAKAAHSNEGKGEKATEGGKTMSQSAA
jgi:chromosome segregation ATPase